MFSVYRHTSVVCISLWRQVILRTLLSMKVCFSYFGRTPRTTISSVLSGFYNTDEEVSKAKNFLVSFAESIDPKTDDLTNISDLELVERRVNVRSSTYFKSIHHFMERRLVYLCVPATFGAFHLFDQSMLQSALWRSVSIICLSKRRRLRSIATEDKDVVVDLNLWTVSVWVRDWRFKSNRMV